MSWTLVDTDPQLIQLLERYRSVERVAVDTEFRRRDTFYPQPALLQLCWGGEAYLIDPLAIEDVAPLSEWLANPSQQKMIHSASEDLEVFDCWLGDLPAALFDTQRAAALLGFGVGLGYRALVHAFCEVDLPKDETQSDWMQRPLTSAQAQYAAQDVSYLFPIGERLYTLAEERGRLGWILEDSARMETGGKPPLSKFKNLHRLTQPEQQRLAAVVLWRERESRRLDRPRSWIMTDQLALAVARAAPGTSRDLGAVAGMPHGLVRRAGEALLAALGNAAHSSEIDALLVDVPMPLNPSQRQQLAGLSDQIARIAETHELPAEILMPKAERELWIRRLENDALEPAASWSGWRHEVLIAPLLAN